MHFGELGSSVKPLEICSDWKKSSWEAYTKVQLKDGNFLRHVLKEKISNQKVNNAIQEREGAKIVDVRKKIQNCRGKVPATCSKTDLTLGNFL